MIEELGILLMLLVILGVIFTALIVGKGVLWAWHWIAEKRDVKRQVEDLRWSNVRNQHAHVCGRLDGMAARIEEIEDRLTDIEIHLNVPDGHPVYGVNASLPKDVPSAKECEGPSV